MRTIVLIFTFFICLSADTTADNALENTTWKGTFNIPDVTEGLFVFKKDTVTVMINDYAMEVMKYSVKGDTLSLTKLMGDSPCNTQNPGLYQFNVNGDMMTLKMLSDNCIERSSAISQEAYEKQ